MILIHQKITRCRQHLKVNIEAIREIPRQLRLRGLGGKIIIETGPLLKKHRKKIEEVLSKSALYSDKLKIVGWSNLGNLELEMPRSRFFLNDMNLIKLKKICISKMYYRQLFNLTLKNIYPRLPWNQVARVAQG